MQKKFAAVLSIIVLFIIALVIVMTFLKRVPQNDPLTVGNTSGNLNNLGYFCEDAKKIYFANASDKYYLYSMNKDGSELTCLVKSPVRYINSAGDYLYFYQETTTENGAFGTMIRNNGVYRLKKGKNNSADCLDRTASKVVSLIGNILYYEHYTPKDGIQLYSVPIDKGERGLLNEEDINPACVVNGVIYYASPANRFALCRYQPAINRSEIVLGDPKTFQPVYDDGKIYFMNVSDDYKIYALDMNSGEVRQITDCRVDAFNVYQGVIFYQKNDPNEPALMRMNASDLAPLVVANGNYCDINITSQFTYFRDFTEDNFFYFTGTVNESLGVNRFRPE